LVLCWPSRGTPTTPARFCDSSGDGRAARRSQPRASRSVEPGQPESAGRPLWCRPALPSGQSSSVSTHARMQAVSSCLIGLRRVDGA
jgi:hypothetical protein